MLFSLYCYNTFVALHFLTDLLGFRPKKAVGGRKVSVGPCPKGPQPRVGGVEGVGAEK